MWRWIDRPLHWHNMEKDSLSNFREGFAKPNHVGPHKITECCLGTQKKANVDFLLRCSVVCWRLTSAGTSQPSSYIHTRFTTHIHMHYRHTPTHKLKSYTWSHFKMIHSPENVAVGKMATMSSYYNSSSNSPSLETSGPACLAVNGNTSSSFAPINMYPSHPNCISTSQFDVNATWHVDLGQVYAVNSITIYMRAGQWRVWTLTFLSHDRT